MSEDPTRTLESIIAQGGEADDVLRATVALLAEEPGVLWAGIAFLENGALGLGPAAGEADETRRARTPIAFQGAPIGELWVDGDTDRFQLDSIAALVAPYVLIGWDTGGESWEP